MDLVKKIITSLEEGAVTANMFITLRISGSSMNEEEDMERGGVVVVAVNGMNDVNDG